MLSLKESMELAGQNLIATLAPGYHYLPMWRLNIERDLKAEAEFAWPSHNVGRWWDALLRLEAATGFQIPAEVEAPMLDNLKRCLDNSLGVVCHIAPRKGIEPDGDPIGWFDDHSQREILLALAGLLRCRGDAWAGELGSHLVRKLDSYILENGEWDFYRMGSIVRAAGVPLSQPVLDFYASLKGFTLIGNTGRLIEALLEFYLASGDGVALKLAERLANIHYEVSTRADGSTPYLEHIHTHSLLGTYRGLLQFGLLTHQPKFIERMAITYHETVRKYVRTSGFISHDLGKEHTGETAAPGDAAQLALWLSRVGHPELLEDAERLVRCRILPSQITQSLELKPRAEDGLEEHSHLARRALGAYGGMITHVHGGKTPTTDITAADLHTLCDIYTHIVEETPLGLQVNFHFDFEDDRICIREGRGEIARLEITLKQPQPLFVRIPGWAPKDSVRLWVDGLSVQAEWFENSVMISKAHQPIQVVIEYALPVTEMEETTGGINYHFTWRGDEIMAMEPNTDWLPFYPASFERTS